MEEKKVYWGGIVGKYQPTPGGLHLVCDVSRRKTTTKVAPQEKKRRHSGLPILTEARKKVEKGEMEE